jgi:hypothetical protein
MIPDDLESCSIHEAEYVEYPPRHIEKILEKWGIGEHGELAPPSKGGFGCITELGKVTMWQAKSYWRKA